MKRLHLLLAGIFIALPFQLLIAQDLKTSVPISIISKEGITSVRMERNIDFSTIKFLQDGEKIGTRTEFGFDFNAMYNVRNKIGIGGSIHYNTIKNKFTNETTNSEFIAFVNGRYIEELNTTSAVYGSVGIGYGIESINVVTPSGSNKLTDNIFAFRGAVGMPIHLDRHAWITPEVEYQYRNINTESGKITDNRISAGVNLEAWFACHDDLSCDSRVGYKHSANAYDPGKNFLGFWTMADFAMGGTTTTFDNSDQKLKDKYSDVNISVDYTRYLWKNIGIGAEFGISNSVQESKDADFKFSFTDLEFKPHIVLNAPFTGGWNNLYLELEGGWGTQTAKTTIGSNSNTVKDNLTSFGFGFGYNCFVADNIIIAPVICWDHTTAKNDESGEKETRNGLSFGLGIRTTF